MSIRGTVTFECDTRKCHAEHVCEVNDADANIERDGLSVQAYAEGWRVNDDGDLVCPDCAGANPREKGDDDGMEYGHPRDAKAERL